jgi:tetratricopeptide (TPR) repeat protein/CHAT domain-containing protein
MKLLACLLLFCVSCTSFFKTEKGYVHGYDKAKMFQESKVFLDGTYDEYEPSVDKNSHTVAYVARVYDNVDIYLKKNNKDLPLRLTTHPTDDSDPSFSKNGKWIAWTSQSEDVKGDIWVMKKDGSSKRKLTNASRADSAPSWGDDDAYVYYTARGYGLRETSIRRVRIEDGYDEELIKDAWDPVFHPSAKLVFYVYLNENMQAKIGMYDTVSHKKTSVTQEEGVDAWPKIVSCDQKTYLFFVRYSEDDNKDGIYNTQDTASIWKLNLDSFLKNKREKTILVPVTSGESSSFLEDVSCEHVYYTVSSGVDLDIHTLPSEGFINVSKTDEAVYESAVIEPRKAVKKMALQYLVQKKSEYAPKAMYQLAKDAYEQENRDQALQGFQWIYEHSSDPQLSSVSYLEWARVKLEVIFENEKEQHTDDEVLLLKEVENFGLKNKNFKHVVFKKHMIDAMVYQHQGLFSDALKIYQHIAYDKEAPSEDAARALDFLNKNAFLMNDIDVVESTSKEMIKRCLYETTYVQKSIDRWMKLIKQMPAQESLAVLSKIASEYKGVPYLSSKAMFEQASMAESMQRSEVSFSLWENVTLHFSSNRDWMSESLFKMASFFFDKKNYDQALVLYERILEEFPDKTILRNHSKKYITKIAMEKGLHFESLLKWNEAVSLYEKLLKANSEHIEARRHWIVAMHMNGTLDQWLKKEKKKIKEIRFDKHRMYGLAYAMTYVDKKEWSKTHKILENVLILDPRFAAAHLSIGYVRERLEEIQKGKGWLEKALSSYDDAKALADPVFEPYIHAGALLGKGNVFFALGKTDDAFLQYLEREKIHYPFENSVQKLIFKENFARSSLREEHYDVAIHMAKEAIKEAHFLGLKNRVAYAESILGSSYYLAQQYHDAFVFYEKALKWHDKNQSFLKSAVMLRGMALSLKKMNRYEESLDFFTKGYEFLNFVKNNQKKEKGFFVTEIPVDEKNITRGLYGFSYEQEKDIFEGEIADVLLKIGQKDKALEWIEKKSERLKKETVKNTYARKEYMLALNKSALLLMENKWYEKALHFWSLCLEVSVVEKWNQEALMILENITRVLLADEKIYTKNKHEFLMGWMDRLDLKEISLTTNIKKRISDVKNVLNVVFEKTDIESKKTMQSQDYAYYIKHLDDFNALDSIKWFSENKNWRFFYDQFLKKSDLNFLKKAIQFYIQDKKWFYAEEEKAFVTDAYFFLKKENQIENLFFVFEKSRNKNKIYKKHISVQEFQKKVQKNDVFIQISHSFQKNHVLSLISFDEAFFMDCEKTTCLENVKRWIEEKTHFKGVVYLDDGGFDSDFFNIQEKTVGVFSAHDAYERWHANPFIYGTKKVFFEETNLQKIRNTENVLSGVACVSGDGYTQADHRRDVAYYYLNQGFNSVVWSDSCDDQDWKNIENTWGEEGLKAPAHFYIYGSLGFSREDRVVYATSQLFEKAKTCASDYKEALQQKTGYAWQKSLHCLEGFLHIVEFLKEEKSKNFLVQSSNPVWVKTASMLDKLYVENKTRMASVFVQMKDFENALKYQKEVLDDFLEKKDVRGVLSSSLNLGRFQYDASFFKESLNSFHVCIENGEKVQDFSSLAECWMRIGNSYKKIFAYEEALSSYGKALDIYRKEKSKNAVQMLRYIASVYESALHDYEKAFSVYQEALKEVRLSLDGLEQENRLILDIARMQRQKGLYQEALSWVDQLLLKTDAKENQGEAFLEKAKILWYMARYKEALSYVSSSLGIASSLGDAFLEIQCHSLKGLISSNQGFYEQAETSLMDALYLSRSTSRVAEEASQLNNLGVLYRDQGFYEKAYTFFSEALSLDVRYNNLEGQAYDMRNLAVLELRRHQLEKALDDVSKAIEYGEKTGSVYNNVQAFYVKGEILSLMHQKEESLVWYTKALESSQKYHIPEITWRAVFALGMFEHSENRFPQALKAYREALDIADGLGVLKNEKSSGKTKKNVVSYLVKLAFDMKDVNLFLEISERERRVSWRDLYALDADLADIAEKKSSFMAGGVELKDVQEHIQPAQAVVSYHVSENNIWMLWIDRKSWEMKSVVFDESTLLRTIDSLRMQWNSFAPVEKEREILSEILLKPFQDKIKKTTSLYIMPHASLFRVPFAALSVEEKALVDVSEVAYALSWKSLQRSLLGKNVWIKDVVAVAPDKNLFFSQLEAKSVAGERAFIGGEASFDVLQKHSAHAWDVAAHVDLDVQNPVQTRVLLPLQKEGSTFVKMLDVLKISSVPSLVSLSACDAASSEQETMPWAGLAAAFMASGAQTVVAGQTRVSDLASAVFMKRFYRALSERKKPGKAFQEASQWVKKEWPHPAHWAGFVMFGQAD